MSNKIRFRNKNYASFYSTLKLNVDKHFSDKNGSKHADSRMILKTGLILSAFVTLYFTILFADLSLGSKFGLVLVMGFVTALIGFNVCHDAIHGSYSYNSTINKSLGLIFNVIGANAFVWHITHNIAHHTYTNIKGADEDIEIAPGLVRVNEKDEIKSFHKYQHIYTFILYGFASIAWVFKKDYKFFFQKSIGGFDNSRKTPGETFKLFFFKIFYYTFFIIVPFIVLDLPWWQFLAGFIGMHLIEGWTLALVFPLAHVVDNTDFPEPDENGDIHEAWAAHQMRTTANFATGSPLATWLTGGLNMQIEHHLFPNICHIHYPAISSIVRTTAEEFGLPYHENKTFWDALKAHYNHLKKFGWDEHIARKRLQESQI